MSSLIGALMGATLGVGVFTTIVALRGFSSRPGTRRRKLETRLQGSLTSIAIRLAIALAGAVAAGAFTGWLVASFVVGVAAFVSPTVIGAKSRRDREMDRLGALATWVEMLRDTISAASGLTETLKATADSAPTTLRSPLRQLAARAEREPLPEALARFADEVDHPVADTVAVSLGLAATNQVGSLQESLAELAESTRGEVSMRLRIEASRARQFASARLIAGVVAVFSIAMVGFSRTYLAPFDTVSGQVALAAIGGLFVGSGIALERMSRFSSPARILEVHRIPDAPSPASELTR